MKNQNFPVDLTQEGLMQQLYGNDVTPYFAGESYFDEENRPVEYWACEPKNEDEESLFQTYIIKEKDGYWHELDEYYETEEDASETD